MFKFIILIASSYLTIELTERVEVVQLQHLKLSGTHYEIGRTFGKFRRGLDDYATPSEERFERALKCEDLLKEHTCDLHDELLGFSNGIGLSLESVIAKQLLPHEMSGCNLFFVNGERTESGYPIFVRHMDWIEDDLQRLTMLETRPLGKHYALGLSFAELGCFDGINTVGLAVGTASVPFFTGQQSVGLLDRYVARWALDNFSSVEETVDYLKSVPHAEAINFLVGDKTGVSARVEVSPTRVRTEVLDEGINIVNNFFMLQDMREIDNMPEDDRSWIYHRRIHDWFLNTELKIGLKQVKEICRNHETGICEHLNNPLGGTIYSWFSELGTGMIHLAVGYPCKNDYHQYQFTK